MWLLGMDNWFETTARIEWIDAGLTDGRTEDSNFKEKYTIYDYGEGGSATIHALPRRNDVLERYLNSVPDNGRNRGPDEQRCLATSNTDSARFRERIVWLYDLGTIAEGSARRLQQIACRCTC